MVQLGMMSLQATVAIAVVLVLRKIFDVLQVPKKYIMLLWIIPFFMLICPWKISSPVGFWNGAPGDYNAEYAAYLMEQGLVLTEEDMAEPNGLQIPDGVQNQTAVEENADTIYVPAQENKEEMILAAVGGIWFAGMLVFLAHAVISYLRLKKKVQCSIRKADNIYYVDDIPAPIVIGIRNPRIFLPSGMEEAHITYVVEHEKTHIRRKDPLVKLAAYVIACVHWFNPFVWLAYYFLEKDMEMACDEETIRRIGMEKKKAYATALLQLSVGKRGMFAVPPAFGEGDTKGRIKNVMRYKKTVKAAVILAVAAGLLVMAVFMTKQEQTSGAGEVQEGLSVSEMEQQEESAFQESTQPEEEQEQPGQEAAEPEQGNQEELTFDVVREAAADHTLHELDFHSYSNGEKWYFEDSNALNYYIDFHYEYEGEIYEIGASHMKENDELSDIYITRESDSEMRWLYSFDDGVHEYSDQLEILLTTKENVDDWLSVELPEGYSLGAYRANLGNAGGALISPQAYELYGEDVFAPQEWYYAGFVGMIPYAGDYFQFDDGKLVDGQVDWWNHTSYEQLGVLDLDWQALWVQCNHDLYTAAGVEWLEEDGIDTSQIDTTSDYWYFFFAKEGEERAYYLSLSAKLFTKEEALAIAETVDIK